MGILDRIDIADNEGKFIDTSDLKRANLRGMACRACGENAGGEVLCSACFLRILRKVQNRLMN